MKIRKKSYWLLLVLTLVFTLLAVSTILPDASASKVSQLGYKAHCSYAPISTVICLSLSAVTCTIRKRLFTSME